MLHNIDIFLEAYTASGGVAPPQLHLSAALYTGAHLSEVVI